MQLNAAPRSAAGRAGSSGGRNVVDWVHQHGLAGGRRGYNTAGRGDIFAGRAPGGDRCAVLDTPSSSCVEDGGAGAARTPNLILAGAVARTIKRCSFRPCSGCLFLMGGWMFYVVLFIFTILAHQNVVSSSELIAELMRIDGLINQQRYSTPTEPHRSR